MGGDEAESSRPYLRFGKRSTISDDDFVSAKEAEVSDNILDENQDQEGGNMMKPEMQQLTGSNVNFDEEKIKEEEETSLPLNRPTRDAEFFEDPTNSDEAETEAATNSNEEWHSIQPFEASPRLKFLAAMQEQQNRLMSFFGKEFLLSTMARPTRSFMARPTRSKFMVRPTRSFMARPTRAQFMARPTRSFMARPTRAQFMVRPTRNSMA